MENVTRLVKTANLYFTGLPKKSGDGARSHTWIGFGSGLIGNI